MMRIVTAFIISIVAHVAIIGGITMPMNVPSHPKQLMLLIKNPEVSVNQSQQEELLVKDEIQSDVDVSESLITDASPDVPPDTAIELPSQVSESVGIPAGEIETGQGESAAGSLSEGSGDNGSTETEGQGDPVENSGGPGISVIEQNSTGDGGDTENPVGPDLDAICADYRQRVLGEIDSEKAYPQVARRLEQEGEVAVRITVLTDGTVTGITIARSSGIESLDSAARNAINSASPLPPIPDELGVTSLVLSLQIVFSLD